MTLQIRPFGPADEASVIALWQACGLLRPWNDPKRDIQRKLTVQPELFLVGTVQDQLLASAMGGFDGHRGWVNYLGVAPHARAKGYGRELMHALEQAFLARGCPKINLQIRSDNEIATNFYRALGYETDAVISMGKRLIPD